jgi:hypothetical protein
MPRRYTVTFEQVSAPAAQDLILIKGGAGKMLRILRVWVGATNTTAPTAQMVAVRARTLPTSVTNGSGGTAPTPVPMDPGDSAATFTARVNDTTKAVTSGTATIAYENGAHIFAGDDHAFLNPPIIGPTSAFVFELLSTLSGGATLSGGVEVEEVG